jgi:hypothetical protein
VDSVIDASLPFPEADLRDHPPRNARVMIGGLYFLARTIDKAKAKINGTLGEYKIGPGISMYLFEWLGISEGDFVEAVRALKTDEAIVAWIHERTDAAQYDDINVRLSTRAIRDDEHFEAVLPAYPLLSEHPHLRNWFEIFDLDDEWIFDPKNHKHVPAGQSD